MIHNIFPIPIGEYDFNNHPKMATLLREIKTSSSTLLPHGLISQGVSSHDSNTFILNSNSLSNLKNDIQKCINNYCSNIKSQSPSLTQSWFNIMGKGGKTSLHSHEGSVLSGALYPLLEKNSCNLIFHFPLKILYNNFIPLDYKGGYTTTFNVPIKENYLYLFPSWLEHETKINKSKNRIVVSFNTKYTNYLK